jgi:hypothetical protein
MGHGGRILFMPMVGGDGCGGGWMTRVGTRYGGSTLHTYDLFVSPNRARISLASNHRLSSSIRHSPCRPTTSPSLTVSLPSTTTRSSNSKHSATNLSMTSLLNCMTFPRHTLSVPLDESTSLLPSNIVLSDKRANILIIPISLFYRWP